jgi:hypothetical protein
MTEGCNISQFAHPYGLRRRRLLQRLRSILGDRRFRALNFLAVLNIDSGKLTEQRFLNFAYHAACRGAAGRTGPEWLSELLDSCDATTRKVWPRFSPLLFTTWRLHHAG